MARKPVLESAVMGILWETREGLTPREVHTRLKPRHDVAYTTVTTVVTRLWKKGLLERRESGKSFVYTPSETQEQNTARRMEELLDLAADRGAVLNRFVGQLSDDDIRFLKDEIS